MQAADATTICALASAVPAVSAVLRLSGPAATSVLQRCGLDVPPAWCPQPQMLSVAGGACPLRVLYCPAPRSFTGEDLVELVLPGAPVLVQTVVAQLQAAGAEAAGPGDFTRRALAHGRLSLDQAEALLAVAQAGTAAAAQLALRRLQGQLSAALEPMRQRLIALRAQVEAGLDFLEEEDVQSYDPVALQAELQQMRAVVASWRRAEHAQGCQPLVCLVGPANAGKSALFAALSGQPALISAQPGTTRDWLQADIQLDGVPCRLIDTAGWLTQRQQVDEAALRSALAQVAGAAVIIACSAIDAPLPLELPPDWRPAEAVIVATKADLGVTESRAVLAVSTIDAGGLAALRALIAERVARLGSVGDCQQGLLARADRHLGALASAALPEDVLLAEELRAIADALGELVGVCTPDAVLDQIFSRFCIGK